MAHEKMFDIKLIRLVRDNPVLYDHNNVKYMDFNAREVAWQKIGDELKRPAAECKVRWINIRDVYRRLLRKNISSPGKRCKTYKYENEVSFMRPFYRDVLIQNVEFESDDKSNDQWNAECDDVPQPESDDSDNKPVRKLKKSKSRKKKKRSYEEEDELPTATSFIEATQDARSEFDPSDPVDAFLLSIGATLKTFTPYHLNLAKSKIFSVVQEHDLQQIVQKTRHDVQTNDIKVSTSDSIYLQ